MIADKFWITSRLPCADFAALGIEIGRSVRLSDGGLHCHHDCTVPDDAIDPLFDLWNETKLMFGYEDDPEDENHSESYLQITTNRDNIRAPSVDSPPVKKVAAIRRPRQ
jgi:hypothetical protein